jgi:hypothetical protein
VGGADRLERAESAFRRACDFFDEKGDVDRQWAYLGHLACDRGADGLRLWAEVLGRLPELAGPRPVTGAGTQYLLALQLKGVLTFAPADLLAFLGRWGAERPVEQFPEEERERHPFGLIHQAVGLLRAEAWRRTKESAHAAAALASFDRAANLMGRRGPLLKALSHLAAVRRELFAVETGERAAINRLGARYLALRGHLADSFPEAWSEDEAGKAHGYFGRLDPGVGTPLAERVWRVLGGARFNYW